MNLEQINFLLELQIDQFEAMRKEFCHPNGPTRGFVETHAARALKAAALVYALTREGAPPMQRIGK